ncbi:hypothetical protein ACFOU0_09335 [Salinicoccus sesuvii]|uniref:Uncharacterized protein n=1 Tax=Salinicoccus sesuvii TaxID=868281 RepID=A0ABV7N866_9STAP
MVYVTLMLPIIFLTAVLLFTRRSMLFNNNGRSMKNSDADIFLKWMIGMEIVVVGVLIILSSM